MFWKKRYVELLATIFFMFMIIIVFLFEILIIRPYLISNNCEFVSLHVSLAFFILFNTCSNLFKVIYTETSTIGLVMPSTLLPQWHYCYICESNVPPRSYHCNICNRCILRRDHHCVFTACCIGYKNYKYYMGLLFQVSLACIYASLIHWPYVWTNMKELGWLTAFGAHCIPMGFWIFGIIDLWTMCCNIISMLCIIGALFSTGLFFYHFYLLVNNQTTYERVKMIHNYDLKNWRLNLTETLGDRWVMTLFLTPHIDSRLPGDGLHFPKIQWGNKQS